mgnify:CR=1 FL=1
MAQEDLNLKTDENGYQYYEYGTEGEEGGILDLIVAHPLIGAAMTFIMGGILGGLYGFHKGKHSEINKRNNPFRQDY